MVVVQPGNLNKINLSGLLSGGMVGVHVVLNEGVSNLKGTLERFLQGTNMILPLLRNDV
jgi:hypothetical protein